MWKNISCKQFCAVNFKGSGKCRLTCEWFVASYRATEYTLAYIGNTNRTVLYIYPLFNFISLTIWSLFLSLYLTLYLYIYIYIYTYIPGRSFAPRQRLRKIPIQELPNISNMVWSRKDCAKDQSFLNSSEDHIEAFTTAFIILIEASKL